VTATDRRTRCTLMEDTIVRCTLARLLAIVTGVLIVLLAVVFAWAQLG